MFVGKSLKNDGVGCLLTLWNEFHVITKWTEVFAIITVLCRNCSCDLRQDKKQNKPSGFVVAG